MDVIHVMAHFKSMVLKKLAKRLPRLTPTPPSLLRSSRRKRNEGHGEQNGGCGMNGALRVQRTKGSAEKRILTHSFKLCFVSCGGLDRGVAISLT